MAEESAAGSVYHGPFLYQDTHAYAQVLTCDASVCMQSAVCTCIHVICERAGERESERAREGGREGERERGRGRGGWGMGESEGERAYTHCPW